MSRSNARTCNQCEKHSQGPLHTNTGWMSFAEDVKIVYISESGYVNFDMFEYDFCSVKCFKDFLNNKEK